MLGWCMIIMALLIRLGPISAGIIGLVIIAGQQVFHYVPQIFPHSFQISFGRFWNFIYPTGIEMPENIAVLYVLIPWIGVMAAILYVACRWYARIKERNPRSWMRFI